MYKDTTTLLQDLYEFSHIQAELGTQDLSLIMDWARLRLRIEKCLVQEGIALPELPEVPVEEED